MGEQMAEAWTEANPNDPDPMVCVDCGRSATNKNQLVTGPDKKRRHGVCHRVKFMGLEPDPPQAAGAGLTVPQPPPPPPKTYGSNAPVAKNLPAEREYISCFSVQIPSQTKRDVVAETLNGYLVEQTEFGSRIQDVRKLGDGWFDLLVAHTVHITDAFAAVLSHAWVQDGEAKPMADFGMTPTTA
jgi:hypothetical protein